MTTDELLNKIAQWGMHRKIIGPGAGGTVDGQIAKLREEHLELVEAVYQGDLQACADAIGDITVVLVMLSELLKLDYASCIHLAYNQIKDRRGVMVDGCFVKEDEA
jgi:NTP pyrophosphatase (non-canonical NTP hydrolase)